MPGGPLCSIAYAVLPSRGVHFAKYRRDGREDASSRSKNIGGTIEIFAR
jgi:hypothetical protein